jgi:UDP-N-acetylmuramoyl-L-alanyl-D-glutamate--2,6-diaminopimelate ligase
MILAEAVAPLDRVSVTGDDGVSIDAVDYDSKRVRSGSLFCCLVGSHHDGHDFAAEAVDRGAVALLVERVLPLSVPQVVVEDTRRSMALAAANLHHHPSLALTVIGVTGTNGKTTTVQLVVNMFEAAGRTARAMGTLTGTRTTPESPDLQATLAGWRDEGVHAVAMEVSSHALALHRVDGTRFRVAVFTNLSGDHLDFHGTMDDYYEAKARLFAPEFADAAVVNRDSSHGRRLIEDVSIPTVGYSVDDLREVEVGIEASRFRWRGHPVLLPIGGAFNLSNAVAAAEAAVVAGLDEAAIVEGLARPVRVPGRFEVIPGQQPFSVVVDYAHTPDALERLLGSARELAPNGQLTVVFGCGGERDQSKRPAMGQVAARLADRVVLTADNSRGEDTGAIIDAVRQGFDGATPRRATELVVEPDRRAAITIALAGARDGDIVLIAGKGHEQTLTLGTSVVPFDDRVVAREELTKLTGVAE